MSNIKDPEERRAALQGRIGAVQQITGQAESLGLTNLLSPDQLTKFKSNLFTQSTLGSGISAVQENLLQPAGTKLQEKALGTMVKNDQGVYEKQGGLEGDSKKAVADSLSVTVNDYLNKLKEIGSSAGTTGGNMLSGTAAATQASLNQPGGATLEQLLGAISNINLEKYGLTEEQQTAGQMVQAETLASANQITDVGLGQNLVTAQDDLSKRTKDLSSLFGSLVDSVDVTKIAELPKVTETIVTSITNLNTKLDGLRDSAEKAGAAFDAASKTLVTAEANLKNLGGGKFKDVAPEVAKTSADPQKAGGK